ncbi:bifunctional 4-hydroxy-2-oxoglutarate aldolase/2-dehydro-3-deoxy-phosphogluconate aldolase [soil metagenome]
MLEQLTKAPIVAVLRAPTAEAAIGAVDALVAGGVTAIEVTYSTPDAAGVIREVARRHGAGVSLGAGTINNADQAAEAAEAGAQFLVSPGSVPHVAAAMLATGRVTMLGALTPTEVMIAQDLGAHVVKVFPASLGGPAYLRALRGPFPDVPLMPTGGVNADNIAEWFAAGAIAVGAGGDLVSSAAMASGDWLAITESARSFVAALP